MAGLESRISFGTSSVVGVVYSSDGASELVGPPVDGTFPRPGDRPSADILDALKASSNGDIAPPRPAGLGIDEEAEIGTLAGVVFLTS